MTDQELTEELLGNVEINSVETFTATIYVGTRKGYNGPATSIQIAQEVVQNYCDTVGLCVTFEVLEFIYTNGREPGFKIGLINYPRFPKSQKEITDLAIQLAIILKEKYNQYRVSVVCTDNTYTIGELN